MFLIGQFFAIMTFQDDRGILDYGKLRSYLFVIGNTFGIHTFDDSFNLFRYINCLFLHDIIIPDDIDFCRRSDQS